MSPLRAEDIASFDVTPSWEREGPRDRDGWRVPEPAPDPFRPAWSDGCQCGYCQLAAGGHL